MEAPKPILITPINEENQIFKPTKEFKLFMNNIEYIISIGKSSNLEKLGIRVKELSLESDHFYIKFYSLKELQNINKYFRIFDNINEVISFFEEIIEEKNASLKLDNNNIILNVKINKIGKGEELISLILNKKLLSLNDICDNLKKEIKNLENRVCDIERLKNDIIKIKEENEEEINELKDEIKLLKEENKKKDLIINEIMNWKKKMEKNNEINYKEIENNKIEENKKIDVKDNSIKDLDKENSIKNLIDSKIIEKKEELNLLTNRLKQMKFFENKNITFKLIFRATRDGSSPRSFHEKCDGISKTFTIIKTIKGIKFGGYIDKKMSNNGGWVRDDEDCFLFSLTYMKIYNPVKNQMKYVLGENIVFSEFGLRDNLFEASSFNILKKDKANNFFTRFENDYEICGGEREFKVEELELFQIIYE